MKRHTFLSPPRLCNMFHICLLLSILNLSQTQNMLLMQHLYKIWIWSLKKNWFEKFLTLLLMCFYGHFKVVTVLSVRHWIKISWETRKKYSIKSRYNCRLSWKCYNSIIILDWFGEWIQQIINKCSKIVIISPYYIPFGFFWFSRNLLLTFEEEEIADNTLWTRFHNK